MDTVTSEIRLDGRLTVRTRPADPGPWPGIVMLHEAWGVDEVMRRLADRLAGFGYLVHLPDLLGEGPWLRCIRRTFRAFQDRSGKPFELIESCRQQLVGDPDGTGKVGVIGFCFGGGFALLVSSDGFHAAAVNYGPVPDDIDTLVERSAPMVASYGAKDRMAAKVPALTAALRAHGVPHDVKIYPSAGHCFLNDAVNGPRLLRPLARFTSVGLDPVAAADAWQRIETFFAEHLAGASPVKT
jgi:carboxymethylenebutenolidase